MARTEARILVSIWNDPEFRALTPNAQWAYMFLLSQPDLAHTGVIPLRVRRWAQAADGMTIEAIREALRLLESARFIVADRDSEELLVRSFIRRDKVFKQPQVFRAAADALPLVVSKVLRLALAEELARVADEDMVAGSRGILAEMRAALPPLAVDPEPHPARQPAPGTPGVRGVVTEVSIGSPNPVPPAPVPSPRQGSPTPARGKPRTKSRTKVPNDFAPTDEMRQWATDRMPNVDVDQQTEVFVNHWRSKGELRADWPATWRNWILRAPQFAGTGNGRASPGGLVDHNGTKLKPETAARLADNARFQAMDQLALEGPAP